MLDGFETILLTTGAPYVSVTRNGITFNKASIVKLEKPSHVKFMINKEKSMLAVQPCDESEPEATPFFKPKRSGLISVRWNNSELIHSISKMMKWNLDEAGYRIDGDYWEEDNAMVFDLKTAKIVKNE